MLGEDITQMHEQHLFELRDKIGMVFQESALFDSMTVNENVAYRLTEEHGVYDDDIERKAREVLRFVELERTLDLDPAELSGGMRRREAIARAMITQPELLPNDSPTGGSIRDLEHHHRTDREATRRIQDQRSAGNSPPAGCFYHGHA